jgi:Zn-dependent protease
VWAATIVVSVVWWLAAINLLLGLFNLLPGAPLDGGRLVRAYLWRRHGDSVPAAIGAAHAGRVVAIILITLGLAEFLAGGLVGGVWLAFIGWFIFAAAREEETQVTTRQVKVRRGMRTMKPIMVWFAGGDRGRALGCR